MDSAEVYPVPFSGMAVHDDLIRDNPELIKRDPLERDPQLVLKGIVDGLESEQAAQEVYGVVLNEKKEAVDLAAPKNFRIDLQQKKSVRDQALGN